MKNNKNFQYGVFALVAIAVTCVLGAILFMVMNPVEQEVQEVQAIEKIPLPPIEDDVVEMYTGYISDFYTMCENTDKFELHFEHVFVIDGVEVSNVKALTRYDTNTGVGYCLVNKPNYVIKSWYNETDNEYYTSLWNTKNWSGWVPVDLQWCDPMCSMLVKNNITYKSNLHSMETLLLNLADKADYEIAESTDTGSVIEGTSTDFDAYGLTSFEDDSYLDNFQTQVVLDDGSINIEVIVNVEDNDFGLTSEIYRYSLYPTEKFNGVIPDYVKNSSADEESLVELYNTLMD